MRRNMFIDLKNLILIHKFGDTTGRPDSNPNAVREKIVHGKISN